MDEELRAVAEVGNVEGLYELIGRNPYILEGFEDIPFAETPLHIAAYLGNTHLAVEIFGLKPSFGRKLNQAGLSPLHLTLVRERRAETATRLVNIDTGLVRLQGKDRMTPLHYAAAKGDYNLVAEFLCVCPDSINDLTIEGDTALHVAARYQSLEALDVLIGWVCKTKNRNVLNWKNENRQTVLDVAQSKDLPQNVVKFLSNEVKKDRKDGLSLPRFIRDKSILEGRFMSFLVSLLQSAMGSETRQDVLVAAVLIATATYQAALSPPGGLLQVEGGHNSSSSSSNQPAASASQPRVALRPNLFDTILFLNSAAFAFSLAVIFLNLQIDVHSILAHAALLFLMGSYTASMMGISSQDPLSLLSLGVSYFGFFLIVLLRLTVLTNRRRRCLKVPTPRYNPSRFLEMRDRMIGS